MTVKWNLLMLFQCELIIITKQSIAGVTYMDHFDFEERYRDVHECDPLHWHPLHLPEHCTKMFEQLIRSRIAGSTPVRVVKRKEEEEIYKLDVNYGYPFSFSFVSYEPDFMGLLNNFNNYRHLSLYEKMLESMKKDVMKQPTAPVMAVMPNFGQVAVYRQPVSRKSENLIKKIAGAYAKADQQDYGSYYGRVEIKHEPPIGKEVDQDVAKKRKKQDINNPIKTNPFNINKNLGNIVTIFDKGHKT